MKKYCKTNDPVVCDEIDYLMEEIRKQREYRYENMKLNYEDIVLRCLNDTVKVCSTLMMNNGFSQEEAKDAIRKTICKFSDSL